MSLLNISCRSKTVLPGNTGKPTQETVLLGDKGNPYHDCYAMWNTRLLNLEFDILPL